MCLWIQKKILILYIPKTTHFNIQAMLQTSQQVQWHGDDHLDFITKELTQASANVMTSVLLLLLRQDFCHLLHHSHGNYAILIEREKQTTAILPASWPTCDLNEADPMAAFAVPPFVASSFISDLWLYPRQSSSPSSSKVFPAEKPHTSETTVLYHPTL